MDTSKPFGEACTANGGLKEAHEIEWLMTQMMTVL